MQRIARIDRGRWIGYSRARDGFEGLERLLRAERRQRPDNLLIVGASNNGKTAIARRSSRAYYRRKTRRHGVRTSP